MALQRSAPAFDLRDGAVDVRWIHEPKGEVCDTAADPSRRGVLGESEGSCLPGA
jgi:hypothetical protein